MFFFSGAWTHANLDWTFGPLRYVIASPVFHRWHHSADAASRETNYAPMFPVWDLMFGTFHMPRQVAAGALRRRRRAGRPDRPADPSAAARPSAGRCRRRDRRQGRGLSAIAGVVRADGRDLDPDLPQRLRAATPFLGREGVDAWREGPAALLRFALRVTPQSLIERQPCRDPSGALLVMDGRLDNRQEVAARLGAAAPGEDAPDAALALAALERFGDAALELFAGDYALALWRPAERRLLLARSPVGWRPLLWSFDGARLGFATEPRTLIEGLALPRRLNEGFLGEYLSARISSHTDTFWADVQRLPPGSALELKSGVVRVWRWNEGPLEDFSRLSEAEHVERFQALFDQALADAQRAAGPVAAQLSGGLDSSSVVCRSLELWRAGRLAPVHPISTRYDDPASDEGAWIEAVQQHTGVASQQVRPQLFDATAAADWCRQTLHLPLRPHTLGVITPAIDAMTRDGLRVLLTGDGGDDGLRGSLAHWPDLARQGRWASLWAETASTGATGPAGRARLLLSAGVLPALSERRRRRLLAPEGNAGGPAPAWLRPEWVQRIGLAERRRAGAGAAGASELRAAGALRAACRAAAARLR